jgi:hypothetical protein
LQKLVDFFFVWLELVDCRWRYMNVLTRVVRYALFFLKESLIVLCEIWTSEKQERSGREKDFAHLLKFRYIYTVNYG